MRKKVKIQFTIIRKFVIIILLKKEEYCYFYLLKTKRKIYQNGLILLFDFSKVQLRQKYIQQKR